MSRRASGAFGSASAQNSSAHDRGRGEIGGRPSKEYTDEWWPIAHRTWKRIEAEGVPILWVPYSAWMLRWDVDYYGAGDTPTGWHGGKLSSDWCGLLELERRLIEPYVRRAATYEVDLDRDGGAVAEPPPTGAVSWDQPIIIRERRRWTSVLAPIYLQLAEALRRISEGKNGAAFCRECGEAFLTLDARRSMFCNDRERYRHSQRLSRKRKSGKAEAR